MAEYYADNHRVLYHSDCREMQTASLNMRRIFNGWCPRCGGNVMVDGDVCLQCGRSPKRPEPLPKVIDKKRRYSIK